MTTREYLDGILDSQTLAHDGPELKTLRERRDAVENLLRKAYGSEPSIRYAGSKAKDTMIQDSYDLDITCYFDNDSTVAGDTLQEIYDSVADVLRDDYFIELKPSAIRLQCKDSAGTVEDYHIDVVPGRFVDDDREDVFLYRHSGEKGRQKTNLDVHVTHVKDSGVIPAIRLTKLWRVQNNMSVRNFILELLTIELLKNKKTASVQDQLVHVWTELRDNIDDISVEDPANPYGNDLSELFNSAIKLELSEAARIALDHVAADNWEGIYGTVPEQKAHSAAASTGSGWTGGGSGISTRPSDNSRRFTPASSFGSDD